MVDVKNKYKINILIIVLSIHILANKNFVKNLAIYIFENLFPIRAPKIFSFLLNTVIKNVLKQSYISLGLERATNTIE